MKYLCTPRMSWLFMLGMLSGLEILRNYGGSTLMGGVAVAFILAILVADWLIQTHLGEQRAQHAEEERVRRAIEEQEAEDDPNVMARLKALSETVNVQEVELEALHLQWKIAVAEKEKAEEEREDIRKVLNFSRTSFRAEQLECQDLREQLRKAGHQ